MTQNNEQKEYNKKYYELHKEERKEYYKKYNKEHKEELKEYHKKYKEELKEYHKKYNKEHKEELKNYKKTDVNSFGVTKDSIRGCSSYYLFNILKHAKLKDYEIHHCFGYDNHKSFIYIPKELHLQIHQFLRDNEIDADSNHYAQIAHLINECDGYTYIKV